LLVGKRFHGDTDTLAASTSAHKYAVLLPMSTRGANTVAPVVHLMC
jgi:hypothetical protein